MNRDEVGTVWDTGESNSVPGLHLRIFVSGRRCFYIAYATKSGVRRKPKIGENITLSEARKIARHIREQIAMGLDPQGAWELKRQEKTVGEAFDFVMRDYWSAERFEISGRKREVANLFSANVRQVFGKRKLSDVRPVEIRVWMAAMVKRPIAANRSLEVLSKVYAYAIEHEWTERNPCLLIQSFSEKKRKRVPTREELKTILQTLFHIAKDAADADRYAAIYLLALFYTGSRPQALGESKWEHVVKTSDNSGITVSLKGKMTYKFNENETIYIPKQILDLVHLYERLPNGKIFSGKNTKKLWAQMMSKFKYRDLWMRDARKAFASLGLSKGISIDQIGAALNHKSASTTKTYAQEFDDNNSKVTDAIANALDEIKGLI